MSREFARTFLVIFPIVYENCKNDVIFWCLLQGGNKAQNKEKINDKLAEIFAKIGSKENTREVSRSRSR